MRGPLGFTLVFYSMPIPKPVTAFCKLLSAIRDAVLLMLAAVGLCRRRFPRDAGSAAAHQHEEVKSRLPAVEYAQLLAEQQSPSGTRAAACQCRREHGGGEEDSAASAPPACIVCLGTLEATDEVRRLGNCAHAFHQACVDRWIDLGRATCPLCRSDLLPRPRRGRAGMLGLAARLTRVW